MTNLSELKVSKCRILARKRDLVSQSWIPVMDTVKLAEVTISIYKSKTIVLVLDQE